MSAIDKHLNSFRFFSQDQRKVDIEDNLSRALVLCLKSNPLLCHEFIQQILEQYPDNGDYEYLFSNYTEDNSIYINIQEKISGIAETDYRRIYAVATTGMSLSMDDFFDYSFSGGKSYEPITDIFISIKDVAFIIEVKRWELDCRQQLFDQISKLTDDNLDPTVVKPVSFDWKQVMQLISKISNFNRQIGAIDYLIDDFIDLIQSFNTKWLPILPFSVLSRQKEKDLQARYSRLNAALYNTPEVYQKLDYRDRTGVSLDFGWAQEILSYFIEDDKKELHLVSYIWPGNTKGQGYKLFGSSKFETLEDVKEFEYKGNKFKVTLENELKLCHFNKYISECDFKDGDTLKKIITKHNFHHFSGKHNRDKWDRFESFLDDHFKPEYDWRSKCQWEKKFLQTDRSYLTASIGYQIGIWIPFSYLQSIDKEENDLGAVSDLLMAIYEFYRDLL